MDDFVPLGSNYKSTQKMIKEIKQQIVDDLEAKTEVWPNN